MGIPSAPENNQQTVVSNFTVTADSTKPIMVANGSIDIESVYAVFAANIATHGTNSAVFSVLNSGTGGAGTTVVAGPNNFGVASDGGVAITANTPVAMTVVSAAKRLTHGQLLGFEWNEATTDVADATIAVSVRYTQVTPPTQG